MIKKFLNVVSLIFLSVILAQAQDDSMSAVSKPTSMVTDQMAVKTALKVGDKMPVFTLNDSNGKQVSSSELLKQGNLVLVFYRGAWCPFCNVYLKNLQKNLDQIKANGGVLTAVSVENPDASAGVVTKQELKFTVLSDPKLETARKFKIVYQLPPETDELYKSYGVDLVKQNETETPELPLSATYIVNRKGEIVYAFIEPDYKKRAEPEKIIEVLKTLNTKKQMSKGK